MTADTFSISKTAALTGLSRASIKSILATLPDEPSVEHIVAAFVSAVREERGPIVNATSAFARDPNEPPMPRGIYSKSALSEMFMLDRATLTKRLRKDGIKPAYQEKKFVGFRLTDKGKGGKTVKEILEAEDDPKHTEAKIRSLLAQARVKELEYEEKSGAIREDIMREVRDELTKLFKSLYTRMVKRYWRENSRRLRRCKSDVDLQRTGETDQALIFTELKRDFPEMLSQP